MTLGEYRRNKCKAQRGTDDHGSIPAREFRYEILRLCLLLGRIFDKLENPCDGAFGIHAAHADLYNSAHIDRAAHDLIPGALILRERFSCECGAVHRAFAFDDLSVKRDPVSGTADDDLSDRDLLGRNGDFLTVS